MTGKISAELAASLTDELLQRLRGKDLAAKLLIVSTDVNGFGFMPATTHQVTTQEKTDYLRKYAGDAMPTVLPEGESFVQWCARARYRKSHPDSQDDSLAWQGVKTITGGIELGEFDAENSAKKAEQFEQERIEEYERTRQHSLIHVLTGLTGVGKTSFIKNVIVPKRKATLFEGMGSIDQCLIAAERTPVVLLLDEANAAHINHSVLESLLRHPPGILVNGEFKRLTRKQIENLDIVLAMNPLSHGAERQTPSLIARHGNAMLMKVMSLEYVYERILKPVLAGTALDRQILAISKHILAVYKFICQCSKDEVLISPRELQMMALMVLSHHTQHPEEGDVMATVKHYAYIIGNAAVPAANKEAFDSQFKPAKPIVAKKESGTADYKITKSRLESLSLINDFIDLHELRQTSPHFNDAQKYGGIGGIILDGEPGCGKSELILAAFQRRGWREGKHYKKTPASMQPADMIALIDETVDAGRYVWIDEINSIPLNERQWNNILMGLKSDGSKPKVPGGGMIASKNPDYMAGRRELSKAIQRRTILMSIPPYTAKEMTSILIYKGIPEKYVGILITAYRKQREKAEKENLSPLPTFRDLVRVADNFIKSNKKSFKDITEWGQFVREQGKFKDVKEEKEIKEVLEVKEEIKEQEKEHDRLINYNAILFELKTILATEIDENKRGFTGLFFNIQERKLQEKKLTALEDMLNQTKLADLIERANYYQHDSEIVSGKTSRTKLIIDMILKDPSASLILSKKI